VHLHTEVLGHVPDAGVASNSVRHHKLLEKEVGDAPRGQNCREHLCCIASQHQQLSPGASQRLAQVLQTLEQELEAHGAAALAHRSVDDVDWKNRHCLVAALPDGDRLGLRFADRRVQGEIVVQPQVSPEPDERAAPRQSAAQLLRTLGQRARYLGSSC
jgi:hypothetical protein